MGARRAFADVVVHPTQDLTPGRDLAIFRGGPDWPGFYGRVRARQCRGPVPIPVDRRPRPADVVARAGPGLWCGPVSLHFGHMIADFGMRIAASNRIEPAGDLVFSIQDVPGHAPRPFFWDILDHLGVDRGRVRIVSRPTRFERLGALPQAERLGGPGPGRDHLDLMDAVVGPAPDRDLACVYVSRSGLPHGRFAGEGVLDGALAAAGVRVVHPQDHPVGALLAILRRARHLVFAEGSALHALQLLGRIDARVTVLVRRPGRRVARAALRPRTPALGYLDAIDGFLCGLRPDGRAKRPEGLSLLDEAALLAGLARVGIDLAAHWDRAAFARAREADIAGWAAPRIAAPAHPREPDAIARQLRALAPAI